MPFRQAISEYITALKGDEFLHFTKEKAWGITKVVVAEIIGTAIFVGLGCGSTVAFPSGSSTNQFSIVFSFAFAVTIAITALSHISGALINPSLALTAMLVGKLSFPMFLIFTLSECVGAIIGVVAVKIITPSDCISDSFCITLPTETLAIYKAVLAEAFMTFCLSLVLCSAIDNRNMDKIDSMALKFGMAIVAIGLPGAKYTGCSMNPARSFGPAFVSGKWTSQWIYWLGPFLGAVMASTLYQIFFSEPRRIQTIILDDEP
ncbi:aquaporin AQPAe.a-like isoform X2 [Lycorma delicatula]|uniref:aquaporin AQPAe.a-like isoform X2 n=1 Tax=Lycorma delicatula TaxID=130591 RepID=UPI003F51604D